ncbi:MAG: hypothetical protein KAS86_03170 [Candidatus Omnitrophica bacterium]|nr:hypothetical protein [Candidatus Omnitrophota bacterium]
MDYLSFQEHFKDYTVISVDEIRKSFNKFDLRRLSEWQKKGCISKVINGWYLFTGREMGEHELIEVANRIYKPSYVSLEMALSYHGLIPEAVYGITSVSTRRTYHFRSSLADFSYRSIQARLFFGYDLVARNNKTAKIASAEKAVLDYLYLHPELKNAEDMRSIRFNAEQAADVIDEDVFREYLDRFASGALVKRARLFLEVIQHA